MDDNDRTDTGVDNDDVDAASSDVDASDPCAECQGREECIDDTCIDPCEDEQVECGDITWEGNDYDCGSCPAGDCENGSCPDTCGAFYAECGDIFWEGSVHDCGGCDSSEVCQSNRCTADAGLVDLVAGRTHSCATTADGSVECWGQNNYGQLGDASSSENHPQPTPVTQVSGVSTLASFNYHSCITDSAGTVECWGRNETGQLGDGSTEKAHAPVNADGVAAFSVATGGDHTCALVDGERLQCWGDNESGQLGRGTTSDEPQHDKELVEHLGGELESVVDVSLGSAHSCALQRDNQLWCWGENRNGQLGKGGTFDGPVSAEPTDVGEPIHILSAGFYHTCAIAVGGDVFCWGLGEQGQLGDGEASDAYSPVEVELGAPAVDIATGRFHSCAATDDGDVFCWGENSSGQLGQGTTSGQFDEPIPVDQLDEVVSVTAGGAHSCALQSDGQARCWGDNEYGQVGDGTQGNERSNAAAVSR